LGELEKEKSLIMSSNLFSEALHLIFLNISVILFIYFLGLVILSCAKDLPHNKYFKLFLVLLLGFSFPLLAYSIVCTRGITINLLVIIFSLIIAWKYIDLSKFLVNIRLLLNDPKQILREILLCMAVVFSFLLWQLFQNDFFNPDIITFNDHDYTNYITVAHSISLGVENMNAFSAPFYEKLRFSPSMYHYFDIWGLAMIMDILNTNGMYVILYIYTPLIILFCFSGLIAVYNSIDENFNFFKGLIVFSICFFSTSLFELIYYHYFSDRPSFGEIVGVLNFMSFKHFPLLLLFCLSAITWFHGNKSTSFSILLLLPLVNVVMLPVILFSFPFLVFYKYYQKRKLSYNLLILYLSAFLSILLFYYFSKTGFDPSDVDPISLFKIYLNKIGFQLWVKRFISITFVNIFLLLLVLLPLMFFFGWKVWNMLRGENGTFLVGTFLVLLCGLCFSAVFQSSLFEDSQFYSMTRAGILPVMIAVIIASGAVTLIRKRTVSLFASFALIGLSIFLSYEKPVYSQKYSRSFIHSLRQEMKGMPALGVNLKQVDYSSYYLGHHINPFVFNIESRCLSLVKGNHHTVDVNIHDIDRLEKYGLSSIGLQKLENSPLNVFRKGIPGYNSISLEQIQTEFIKKFNVKYLFTFSYAPISPEIDKIKRKELIDPVSKTRILFF
jgi:hypothetical protein